MSRRRTAMHGLPYAIAFELVAVLVIGACVLIAVALTR